MPGISTVVISYNEADNIARCLQSVAAFSDEIIVVDSLSDDGTPDIARQYTDRVISHEWLGYGHQKRLAMEHARGDWIFSIDADEAASPALQQEIAALDFVADGYDMPRKVWYLGRWIEHSGWYPGYILRLFRRDRGEFTAHSVHEYVKVDGKVGRLRGDLYHYSYRDISHHLHKMNDFTSLSAREMFDDGRRSRAYQVTLQPFLEFLKVYFSKKGFLDGLPGMIISTLHAYYVFLKYAKLFELNLGTDKTPAQSNDVNEPRDRSVQ